MTEVRKGQTYADRDSRRKGRKVQVIHVEDGYVTVKVVADSLSATSTSVGNTTDVRTDRFSKAYLLAESDRVNFDEWNDTTFPAKEASVEAAPEEKSDNDFIKDTNDLEDALTSAGYFWLPPADDLVHEILEHAGEDAGVEVAVRTVHAMIEERLLSS